MITRSGLIWCVLALGAAVAAFTVKYEVRDLEDELAATQSAIADGREEIHVLKAEWSYLNRPERLAELAGRYLDLSPMGPGQMASLVDVPLRDVPVVDPLDGEETGTLVTFKVEQP
jgi:cell division protein FtsL